jgi:hypothetical protein
MSGDHFISTQSIPNLPYGHLIAEKGPEPILHVSWEWGCTSKATSEARILLPLAIFEQLLCLQS